MKHKIELLAPAGSYEAFVAAVQNGANAVYLGGNEFSARVFATNFDQEELINAVNYAHLRDVKIYVTMNTLYQDQQFEQLLEYLTFLYTIGVDAIIVQDMGLLYLIKKHFPGFEIHMSTQTSVYDLSGVQYFEELGIQRVVLSRENTLDEIKDICQNTNMDIEVFIHGALCMSYSGQCLMSSFIGKRSGNKGMCAQPCRLEYRLKRDNQIVTTKESYLLSPRDLCTIDSIGSLIEAGVTSFKIEGRMKRPEYVAIIVKEYRRAIDLYLLKKKMDTKESTLRMKMMFNRGFTSGYLVSDPNFMAKEYPGHRGIEIGKVLFYNPKTKRVSIQLSAPLMQKDRIVFASKDFTRTITKLYIKNKLVHSASKGDIIEIELDVKITKGDNVFKVLDYALLQNAQESYKKEHFKTSITMSFIGKMNTPCTLTITDGIHTITKQSVGIVEKAVHSPLSKERIKQQLEKLGNTIYQANNIVVQFDDHCTISIKEINAIRREAIAALNKKRENHNVHNASLQTLEKENKYSRNITGIFIKVRNLEQLDIALQYNLDQYFFPINQDLDIAIAKAQILGKKIIPYTGFMMLDKDIKKFIGSDAYTKIDSVLVGGYGILKQIDNDKKCILDSSFNIYNSNATKHFVKYDFIPSLEMSKKQIQNLSSTNQVIFSVYGKIENMISKHCPISEHYFGKKKPNCNLCKQAKYHLVDRKKEEFPIFMDEHCFMHLYNSRPLYIDNLKNLKVNSILISFTDETSVGVKSVIEDYIFNVIPNNSSQNKTLAPYTLGYYKD